MTGKCTNHLRQEHKLLLRAVYVLEAMADRMESGEQPDFNDVEQLLFFMRKFGDDLHQTKEESVLFPALRRGELLNQELRQMLFEHNRERSLVEGLEEALKMKKGADFVYYSKRLAALLTNHIYKEDRILFEIVDGMLGKEDDERLEHEMSAFGDEIGPEMYAKLARILNQLEWKYLNKAA